jgi:hypothetical protein
VDPGRSASKQPELAPTVALPPGKLEERDLLILLLQDRLEPTHVLGLDAEAFTVPVYRQILTQALRFRNEVGQFDREGFRGAMGDDPAYEMVVAKLSVWDLYLEDAHDHVIGCLRILGDKKLQRRLADLIGQQKIAEREGRHDDVDALNLQMHEIRNLKAGLNVS